MRKKINIQKLAVLPYVLFKEMYQEDSVENLLIDLKKHDLYTYHHSLNVSFYGMLIGKWIGLSGEEIKEMGVAGLLHDIGKIQISSALLNKKEKLTSKEFDEIKMHTIYGYNRIKKIENFSEEIKKAVLMHHEREDQSGYPFGLKRSEMNIHAKIIAVADVYDAMTSERAYKGAKSSLEAFKMFEREGGKLFNNPIVKTFLKNMNQWDSHFKCF